MKNFTVLRSGVVVDIIKKFQSQEEADQLGITLDEYYSFDVLEKKDLGEYFFDEISTTIVDLYKNDTYEPSHRKFYSERENYISDTGLRTHQEKFSAGDVIKYNDFFKQGFFFIEEGELKINDHIFKQNDFIDLSKIFLEESYDIDILIDSKLIIINNPTQNYTATLLNGNDEIIIENKTFTVFLCLSGNVEISSEYKSKLDYFLYDPEKKVYLVNDERTGFQNYQFIFKIINDGHVVMFEKKIE